MIRPSISDIIDEGIDTTVFISHCFDKLFYLGGVQNIGLEVDGFAWQISCNRLTVVGTLIIDDDRRSLLDKSLGNTESNAVRRARDYCDLPI